MEDISTVFLDRDGVINRLRSDYVTSWDMFEFLPHVKEAIRMLSTAGMRVVVATNQRAVARGLLSVAELMRIHDNMCAELAAAGATINAVYYCPHDKGLCACRKPEVGMFLQAQGDFPEINFRRSVVVGDSLTDMQAGRRLGCRLILITDAGRTDRADEGLDAVQAEGILLDGSARTLYEAVARYIVPVSVRIATD
ncbi:MAG: D-glycero-alpha-D-manno-heptose-1,7-bisphosphate 7-phosphatase [Ktedonobacterales bacterium]